MNNNDASSKKLSWPMVALVAAFLLLIGWIITLTIFIEGLSYRFKLGLAMGWVLVILIGSMGLMIVMKMAIGKIDLAWIISEPNGHASLSRFQFLVFTFVISMSLFLIVVSQPIPSFPDIPVTVLGLLGLSGGSYVPSKGIQASRDTEEEQVKKKVKGEVKEEVKEEVKGEVKDEAKRELRDEVKDEVKKETKAEVLEEVKRQVEKELKSGK